MICVDDRKKLQKGKGYQGWGWRGQAERRGETDLISELHCLGPGLACEGHGAPSPSAAPATAELGIGIWRTWGRAGIAPSPAGHSENSVPGSVMTTPTTPHHLPPSWNKLFP